MRVFVANRGEVVVRVAIAARELGWSVVGVVARGDRSPHCRYLDACAAIDSYLDAEELVEAAKRLGADIVHPGYGFLAEDPNFARRVLDEGMYWAGPSPRVMELLGDKLSAKNLADKLGVPTPPYCVAHSVSGVIECVKRIGVPAVIKRSLGGGGRGQRVVWSLDERALSIVAEILEREAPGTTIVEKHIERPRHVEVQLVGDQQGTLLHLYERECSIQRRRQKVVEEAPSPLLDRRPDLRRELVDYAMKLAEAASLDNVATIEFVVDESGRPYFIECNPRLQVEHGVTEAITGIDIVKTQLLAAIGREIGIDQSRVHVRGWAMEARIYAEDPRNNFAPAAGWAMLEISALGPGIRIDSVGGGSIYVDPAYDTMIAKVISWGSTRDEARIRLVRALRSLSVKGVETNIDAVIEVLNSREFIEGSYSVETFERVVKAMKSVGGSYEIVLPIKGLESPEKRVWQVAARLESYL